MILLWSVKWSLLVHVKIYQKFCRAVAWGLLLFLIIKATLAWNAIQITFRRKSVEFSSVFRNNKRPARISDNRVKS